MNKAEKTILYTLTAIMVFVMPVFAHADARSECTMIEEKERNAESKFTEHNMKLENLEEAFNKELGEELTAFESKRAAQKKNAEDTLKKHIEEVSMLATTPAQKNSVSTYIANVKKISQVRADKIELAQKEYKENIKKMFTQKKNIERVLLSEYKESSKRAFETSIRDCRKGRSSFTLKRELKREIDGNHKKFLQQLGSITFTQSIESLTIDRDKKIQDAQKEFAEKYSTLAKSLRTSFSQ